MPITINGNGTVTGIAVGGLPDGIVDTDMIALDAVTNAKINATIFTSYAIICDEKANGTAGGTFNSGSWETRDLNTEIADPDGIVSISSNQFTLQAGTYLIKAKAPAWRVNLHQLRLQNITDSATVKYGTCGQAYGSGNYGYNMTHSFVDARFIISEAKVFELQHRCSISASTSGFGTDNSFSGVEKYAVVEIYKEV